MFGYDYSLLDFLGVGTTPLHLAFSVSSLVKKISIPLHYRTVHMRSCLLVEHFAHAQLATVLAIPNLKPVTLVFCLEILN